MSHKSDIKPMLETEFDNIRIDLLIRAKMKGIDLSKIKIVNHEQQTKEKAKIKAQAKAMFVN